MQEHDERSKRYGQVVAAAWADPAFKRRLLADPIGALRERGIQPLADIQVRVVEDTAELAHLVLPVRPDEAELCNEQLGRVAGGVNDDDKWPRSA